MRLCFMLSLHVELDQARGVGASAGHVGLPKQDSAAAVSGQRARRRQYWLIHRSWDICEMRAGMQCGDDRRCSLRRG